MRLIVFIILSIIAFTSPLWVFLPLAVCYVLWQRGYELIVLGVFIDAQFGVGVAQFGCLYTLSLGAVVLMAELLKPHLSFL